MSAVNHSSVPRLGDLLNAFPVAKPADVRPIRLDGSNVSASSFGIGIPLPVCQHESNVVLSQQITQTVVQPLFVSNFNREFVSARQLLKKRFQP